MSFNWHRFLTETRLFAACLVSKWHACTAFQRILRDQAAFIKKAQLAHTQKRLRYSVRKHCLVTYVNKTSRQREKLPSMLTFWIIWAQTGAKRLGKNFCIARNIVRGCCSTCLHHLGAVVIRFTFGNIIRKHSRCTVKYIWDKMNNNT